MHKHALFAASIVISACAVCGAEAFAAIDTIPRAGRQYLASLADSIAGERVARYERRLRAVQQNIRSARNENRKLFRENRLLAGRQEIIHSRLDALGHKTKKLDSRIGAAMAAVTAFSQNLRSRFETVWLWIAGGLACLAIFCGTAAIAIIRCVRSARTRIDSLPDIRGRSLRLDFDICELMRRQIEITAGLAAEKQERKPDHAFALAAATEIHKMKKRLQSAESRGAELRSLKRAVSRLEEALAGIGYTLHDLGGRPYVDGMALNVVNFIPTKQLQQGENRIYRMLKPQVCYKKKIIDPGTAEVAVGKAGVCHEQSCLAA
jgi:hypothetical protein